MCKISEKSTYELLDRVKWPRTCLIRFPEGKNYSIKGYKDDMSTLTSSQHCNGGFIQSYKGIKRNKGNSD